MQPDLSKRKLLTLLLHIDNILYYLNKQPALHNETAYTIICRTDFVIIKKNSI